MSLKKPYPLIALALVLLVAAYFYTQVNWEERAVRKQFSQLVELVEKDGAVSKFEALGRSRQLPGFFTENPSVEYFPGRRLPQDTDAMRAGFLSAWGQLDSVSILVLRHEVKIDQVGEMAESNVSMRSSVLMDGSEKMGGTLEYRVFWVQFEGEWRIQEIIALGNG